MPANHLRVAGWGVLAAVCLASLPVQAPAQVQVAPDVQTELLRGAQLWASKDRPDLARQLIEKLLLGDPYLPIGLATLGELALRENKTEEAQRILGLLRTRHPQDPLTQELATLVRVYGPERESLAKMRLLARAGRKEEAASMARTLFPKGPPALGKLALEYFQIVGASSGDAALAQSQLDRLYQQTGESRYRLALLDMQLAQGTRAQTILPSLEALAEEPDVDPVALQNLWRRALDQQGNNAAALRSAQRFLRRFPDNTAMVERLAALQQAQERAQQRARDPANIARKAALRALDQGNVALAEEQLQTVLSLRPRDAESIGNLGLIRLRQGQHAQAQELLGQAFALSGKQRWSQLQGTARFWGLLRQVDVALEKNELGTADALAQKALALQPDSPEALSALAGIRALQNALPQAQALYQQALRQEADNTSALTGLANVYVRSGQSDKAMALLERAAANDTALAGKLAGTRADLLQEQARTFLQAQRPSAALRALESAVALAPDEPWIRHSLAQLYVRLGLPREALSAMDEGIARTPQAEPMRYARALIRSSLDDEAGALSDMQHIAPENRSEGMQELVQRVSVNRLIAQATGTQTHANAAANADALQRAEALARNDAGLLYAVANAWFKRGQPAQGVAVFDRLEKRSGPLPAPVQLDHAALLQRAQQNEAVAQRLPKLLTQRNWNTSQEAQLLNLYATHQERLIERQRAEGRLEQAVQSARAPLPEIDSSRNTPQTALQRRRVQAQLLAAAAQYSDAGSLLQPLVAQLPEDAELRMALGDALARQGRTAEATVQARWLAQHLPSTEPVQQLALLRLWQRAGQMQEARALSMRLLDAAPADTDVLLHAARLERSERHYAQAVALFQRAWTQETRTVGNVSAPDIAATPAPTLASEAPPDTPLALAFSLLLSVPGTASLDGAKAGTVAAPANTVGPGDSRSFLQTPLILTYSLQLASPEIAPMQPGAATGNEALDKIGSEIKAIEARRQAWIEVGQQTLQKNATEGISSLHGWERPLVAWIPRGYDGHYFLHADQVRLDAGELPADRNAALNYGQVAAWPANDYRLLSGRQRGSGSNLGFGFVGDTLEWDIGATGIGFPVTNLVGGIAHSDSKDGFNYKLAVSRRPLTGNLLTYAGAHDPITGQIWGGVVATGVSARVATDLGPYSTSMSASYALLTGLNVRNNTRLQLRMAADRDVWQSSHSSVNLGLALSAWRFGHDLSEFSWGHGGYYSPNSYVSLALPLEWSGRKGALTWLVRAAVSVSHSSSAASDFFPGNPGLQLQAGGLGTLPVYAGSRSSGFGRSFRSAIEYDVAPQLTLGAQLDLDRSAYYAPTSLLFYLRYRFDPVRAVAENRPRPVQPYSSF